MCIFVVDVPTGKQNVQLCTCTTLKVDKVIKFSAHDEDFLFYHQASSSLSSSNGLWSVGQRHHTRPVSDPLAGGSTAAVYPKRDPADSVPESNQRNQSVSQLSVYGTVILYDKVNGDWGF